MCLIEEFSEKPNCLNFQNSAKQYHNPWIDTQLDNGSDYMAVIDRTTSDCVRMSDTWSADTLGRGHFGTRTLWAVFFLLRNLLRKKSMAQGLKIFKPHK